ncbi:HNH endonuclease family protein [Streptosporangium sp. NPDC020072]|uniref:HNH endonuclease family protein n=1 Tax=Streptosporangium sp. NPDC020072 TaxID=3154788 RepID=UPI003415C0D3
MPSRTLLLTTAALALALTGAPGSASATSSPTPDRPATAPQQAAAPGVLLHQAVADLPTAVEDRTGYKRSSFRHWIDADRNGCNARAEVLLTEAVTAPTVEPGCRLVGGTWYSYYDDQTVEGSAGLDVDHLVPLAEAWDSGASAWTAQQRQDYANDLADDYHLVAVTARSNRSKADKDPSQWLPPSEGARCRYVAEWTAVKRNWDLTVDEQEKAALTALAAECPDVPLPGPAEPQSP